MIKKTVVFICSFFLIVLFAYFVSKDIFSEHDFDSFEVTENIDVNEQNNEDSEKNVSDNHNEIESVQYSEPDIELPENEIQSNENDYDDSIDNDVQSNISQNDGDEIISDESISNVDDKETNKNSYVDFDLWQSKNPDMYAWIYVPGTEISYPIVQREGDDGYYLRRDIYGNDATAGTLFTEGSYNGKKFTDYVTVVYGHSMRNGTMFGTLEQFGKSLSFDDNPMIYIYTPESVISYIIVAAVPYSNRHILYYNDFSDETEYNSFFNDIFATRSLIANVNDEKKPVFGDKVIILSTCLKSDIKQRYLIIGKFYSEYILN